MTRQTLPDSVARMVAKYAKAASLHGRATREGDQELANRSYQRMARVCRALRERGPDAQSALLPLVSDPDPAVRGWAASHALEFAPEVASQALSELASGPPSPERLSAEVVLREWRRGALKFP